MSLESGPGAMPAAQTESASSHFFWLILGVFAAIVLLSWPILLSFDLWVLKDRGNLLSVDLLAQQWRLGVDTYYAYGLLPVLLQHLAFLPFGRGYLPMIALDVPYYMLLAVFWARVVRHTPRPQRWLLAVLAMSPILVWVNPNFPYVLVQLSLLFAVLFVLEDRLDLALCASAAGCYCVPSLPYVASGVIFGLVVARWWHDPDRTLMRLLRTLAPAIATFVVLGIVLAGVYGFASVVATLSPFSGMEFYREMRFGLFNRGSGLDFLYPQNVAPKYYLANPAGWWIASSLTLFVFACLAACNMFKQRSWRGPAAAVLLCALIHGFFAFRAYGTPPQHTIYDPVLAAGILIGLASLPLARFRYAAMALLVGLGLLGNWGQVHGTWSAWRQTHRFPTTLGLYAQTGWEREWADVVAQSASQHLMLLSYSTSAHHYFPTIQTADAWTVQTGQLLPADMERLLAKIAAADIVVEDLSGPTRLFEEDPQVGAALREFCLASSTPNFKTYRKRAAAPCGSISSWCRRSAGRAGTGQG
jgi:hypothetical protein